MSKIFEKYRLKQKQTPDKHMCTVHQYREKFAKKSKKTKSEIEIAGKYQKIQTLGRNQLKKMEGNTVQQPLSKYLIIDTAGFIKNPPLQEFGQNLITLREVIGKKNASLGTKKSLPGCISSCQAVIKLYYFTYR